MTARGDTTRQHLLDVAERLFAERGFDAVSLREIRLVAGARNTAAVQFHFGDREGLIMALVDRHMPRIGEYQQELAVRLGLDRDTNVTRPLVEVLVKPVAEYLTRGPSERSWVIIMGAFSSEPELRPSEMRRFAPPTAVDIATRLFTRMEALMPRDVAAERLMTLTQHAVQACADRARIEEGGPETRAHIPIEVFSENLVDMIEGALLAPVSEATLTTLNRPRPGGAVSPGRRNAP